jgi:cytochrome d ubiquinol oxidase subunit II
MTANIWFGFVLLGVILYVTLDGYDLGLGILAISRRNVGDRKELFELVAPVWDGNESWILLIALALWGGFPAATGAFLPAVYLAVVVMLFSFIARGSSIEFLEHAEQWSPGWFRVFMCGSFMAAFAQGVIIGTLIQGVKLGPSDTFVGGSFSFLTGFTVLTGITAIALYALSATALVKMRSSNADIRHRFSHLGRPIIVMVVVLVVLSGVLLPTDGASSLTLNSALRVELLVVAALAVATLYFAAWWSFARPDHDNMAFVCVSLAIPIGLIGLMALVYPMIVPPSLTIQHAASANSSLDFLIGGFGLMVPIVIAYNAYSFWTLRPRREHAGQRGSSIVAHSHFHEHRSEEGMP